MKALPFCARAQSIKQKKKKNDTNMMNDNKLLSADFIHWIFFFVDEIRK